MRWEQFNSLLAGKAQMPEPGFALGLYFAITGDADSGRRAAEWAMGATDVRQVALVYDWCQTNLTPAQNKAIAAKLTSALTALAAKADFASMRDRAFAAVVLADAQPGPSSVALRDIVLNAWKNRAIPILKGGAGLPSVEQVQAIYELMHVVRDNLNIDLRDDFPAWFKTLPQVHLLSHYPAPYPAPENEYRIPSYDADAAPDLRRAVLSRATELSMVAYDTNAAESQFIQGWLMQDRFLMRSPFGITYEFMWANPYQPGLSVFHLPLAVHDTGSGALFVRSSWDEDAFWLGRVGRDWQTFHDGKITVLNTQPKREPVVIGETTLFVARDPLRFDVKQAARAFILGLKARTVYDVEVDDEELREAVTDGAGTLEVNFAPETTTGLRLGAK